VNIFNTNPKYTDVSKIQTKVEIITSNTTDTREDLIQDLWLDFVNYGYHKSYDPEKGSLAPFVRKFINWSLQTRVNKVFKNPEILVGDFDVLEGKLIKSYKGDNNNER